MKLICCKKRIHITEEGTMSVNDETKETELHCMTNSERNERKFSIERLRRQMSLQFRKIKKVQGSNLKNKDAPHTSYVVRMRKMSQHVNQRLVNILKASNIRQDSQ